MFKNIFKFDYLTYFLITVTSLLSHWNIFFFPAYREDEGTYISQAWAVLNSGSLAPYTYWYDHAPVGWFFIAFWNFFTGDLLSSINSIVAGRVFIVLLNVCSSILVYVIAKQLTHNKLYSFLASLLFILTPLAVEFQRRVFLDNIMIFWLLWSVYFSIKQSKLHNIILSAVTFAIAVLSKESAIVFLPVIITSIFLNSHRNNKPFITVAWLAFNLGIISFYPLYALIKGEFFSYGTFLGGDQPHVSLLDALIFQSSRSSGFFWEAESAFRQNLQQAWLSKDAAFILIGSVLAPVINFLFYRKYKWTGFLSMMVFIYIVYLLRGQVLDWYIIPLLPLGAINIALLLQHINVSIKKHFPRLERVYVGSVTALLLVIIGSGVTKNVDAYRYNQTENQRRSVEWIKNNIKDETTLLIDNFAFHDLNKNLRNITDTNIHYYWKADKLNDPQIAETIFDNDWRNIDYLMLTPAINTTLNASGEEEFKMVRSVLNNSKPILTYNEYAIAGDPIANYPVQILEVDNFDFRLQRTWDYFKQEFITEAGQVINPRESNTSSLDQSYALQRAVWMNDKSTFDTLLFWMEDNIRKDNNLHMSQISLNEAEVGIMRSDTGAEINTAFSLIQAANLWNNQEYTDRAKRILDSLWEYSIFTKNESLYIAASDDFDSNEILINSAHYTPAFFRVFALSDASHEWIKLADQSYDFLEGVRNDATGLVPNFVLIDEQGIPTPIPNTYTIGEENPGDYGYQAFKVFYNINLDRIWYDTEESINFITYASDRFFEPHWYSKYDFASEYSLDGSEIENYSDLSTSIAPISIFHNDASSLDTEVYLNLLKKSEYTYHWGNKNNIEDQTWGWIGTALYGNKLIIW